MMDGALHALTALCDDVVIAANEPAAFEWFPCFRVVQDATPGLGALGALVTALQAANGRTALVCAWDMPFVTATLLSPVVAAVDAGASCCVPMHASGQLEPLCAAYGPGCADVALTMLREGERAAHALHARMGGTVWRVDAATDAAQGAFFNVNTPDDLERAQSWLRQQQQRS
jgi:molybdopterin-guanine dinucleotide biosynthesis protein A